MTSEQDLIDSILLAPKKMSIRLVYSDWLEDHQRMTEAFGWRLLKGTPLTKVRHKNGMDSYSSLHSPPLYLWEATRGGRHFGEYTNEKDHCIVLPDEVFFNIRDYDYKSFGITLSSGKTSGGNTIGFANQWKALRQAAISYGEIYQQEMKKGLVIENPSI